jgi:hypothetical protein
MPAAWQREQRWLPGMITDARFLQYLQIALMPNLLVLVVRRSVRITGEFARAIMRGFARGKLLV